MINPRENRLLSYGFLFSSFNFGIVLFSVVYQRRSLDKLMGWDSSVGIATHYRQDGSRIESRRGVGEIPRTCPDHS
jgi:hypothetical protein